jgi:hypothetical protein
MPATTTAATWRITWTIFSLVVVEAMARRVGRRRLRPSSLSLFGTPSRQAPQRGA